MSLMFNITDAYISFLRHAQAKSQLILNIKNNKNDKGLNQGLFSKKIDLGNIKDKEMSIKVASAFACAAAIFDLVIRGKREVLDGYGVFFSFFPDVADGIFLTVLTIMTKRFSSVKKTC